MDPTGKEDIMHTWIERSSEHLDEARFLFSEKMGNALVATKLYHALIYLLYAFFQLKEPGSATHADLILRFEQYCTEKDPKTLPVVDAMKELYPLVHTCGLPGAQGTEDERISALITVTEGFSRHVSSLPE